MAATKSASRKKRTGRKTARRPRSALARLEAELPVTLQDYARRVRTHLTRLERDLSRARARARARGTKLLREASHELGRLEAWGEVRWRKLTGPYRKAAAELLHRLERAAGRPARRKGARKKVGRKKVGRKKAAAKKTTGKRTAARKKAAGRKTARRKATRRKAGAR